MNALDILMRDLEQTGGVLELSVLLASLAVAFGVCWRLGRDQPGESIWFGRSVVDGLLFPVLSLLLVYVAKRTLNEFQVAPLLRVAIPVLTSLVVIRFLARVLTTAFPASGLARLAERLFSWMAWIAAVLWILGLLPQVMTELDGIHFAFGKTEVSLLNVIEGTLSSGAMLILVLWLSATLERRILQQAVNDLSLRKVAANAIRAILLLVGFLFALSAVGVDLTALSVMGGALGVGIGFGLQKLAANYVSGFVILFERSLRIGDSVKVDGFEGTVMDIKTRYTLIRSLAGKESIVPNEKLITERIENYSLADPRIVLSVTVTVGYDSDPDQVKALLEACALRTERVLADPEPGARLAKLGADGLDYELLFWIGDPQNGQLNVRSEVNTAILKDLRAAKIDIPYPQRVVHLKAPVDAAALTARASPAAPPPATS